VVGKYATLVGKLFVVVGCGAAFALVFWAHPEFQDQNHALTVVVRIIYF